MMTDSKVSLTIDHSYILTTDHYDMGIKIKDIQKQVKLKRNQLLISYLFRNMNFQKCEFFKHTSGHLIFLNLGYSESHFVVYFRVRTHSVPKPR